MRLLSAAPPCTWRRRRAARSRALASAALAAVMALLSGGVRGAPGATGFQRGVALGLFSEDAGFSYRPLLDEIARTGADHVELVVAYYLDDVHATRVHEHPRYTAPEEAVTRAVRDAHAAGLRVLLFPILRLEKQQNPNEWRGTLAPSDRAALFASYRATLLRLARLAARERVAGLSVGSELSTLDGDRAPWVPLVREVRAIFPGRLTYSGNWDHYEQVGLYDLVDDAGVCGYFKLSEDGRADAAALRARWTELRAKLEHWSRDVGRPLLLTEVGYLSQRGAQAWPWNEGATEPVDLEDQRRCYEAFRRVFASANDPARFAGVYFWNWYGWGGPTSRGYTPRGKPAAAEISGFFAEHRRLATR